MAVPIVEIPRTEKARSQLSVRQAHLRERLDNGQLPRPGRTSEPDHIFDLLTRWPMFELEEDASPGPLRSSLPVPVDMPSISHVIHVIEEVEICTLLFDSHDTETGDQ